MAITAEEILAKLVQYRKFLTSMTVLSMSWTPLTEI